MSQSESSGVMLTGLICEPPKVVPSQRHLFWDGGSIFQQCHTELQVISEQDLTEDISIFISFFIVPFPSKKLSAKLVFFLSLFTYL